MRKSTIYLYGLGLVVMIAGALASTGLVVSAQNANSSMTSRNLEAKDQEAEEDGDGEDQRPLRSD